MHAQLDERAALGAGSTRVLLGAAAGVGLLVWAALPAQAALPADGFADLAEKVTPAVVNISSTREQLAAELQAWCRRAEESGIVALRDFSIPLRSARA